MNFSQYNRIEIPEGRVKQITRKSDGLLLWKAKYINQVPLSISADGTIYNGTGYKEGYRVRSGGAEAEQTTAVCTGFIPYRQGDILRIYPKYAKLNNRSAFNFSDEGFNNLGQITSTSTRYGICVNSTYAAQWQKVLTDICEETGNVTTLDISGIGNAGEIAYVRVTVPFDTTDPYDAGSVASGTDIIITVNEELDL